MKPNNPPEFTALIGLDWGDKSHAIALEPAGGSTETSTLEHSAETLHQWLDQLEQRFGARLVGERKMRVVAAPYQTVGRRLQERLSHRREVGEAGHGRDPVGTGELHPAFAVSVS